MKLAYGAAVQISILSGEASDKLKIYFYQIFHLFFLGIETASGIMTILIKK